MAELDYEYLASLVKKAQEGNSDAFAEIYVATYKKLYRFTYQYIKDAYLAQDIIQEVYILVLKNLHRLKNPKLFVSWINQINFRVCFNTAKKYQQQSKELDGNTPYSDLTPNEPTTHNGPEEQITLKDTSEKLMEKVLSLPPNESQAIIMKYYNDMKLEEIAYAMDCSRSSVKRYLAHGKTKLEVLLKEQKGGA